MADRALQLAPHNPDALELAGELVRNQHGLEAALPWFEAGLAQAPDNFDLLGEYAATLGELGRARDMLRVTRKMLARDHRNPRALFLQAALAARAGKLELARRLLDLTNDRLSDVPSAMLLEGVLQLRAGNRNLAIDVLDRLTRLRPGNMPAALLLTRALAENGDSEQLVARFAGVAARPDAPAYLLILVGRAEEDLGHRDLAAPLLDRAAAAGAPPLVPLAEGQPLEALALTWRDSPDDAGASVAYVRKLIATGDLAHAEEVAERLRAASPGIAAAQIVAGDVQLLRGRQPAAIERYEQASIARSDDALLLRLVEADRRAGRGAAAVTAVESYLAQTPSSRIAVRLAAISTAESGDWRRARRLLEHLRDAGGQRDARLMSDLTLAQLRDGDPAAALVSARAAYRLQRSSPVATQALAMALAQQRGQARFAAALFDKALRIGGDNPLLTEGRRQLALLR
ncbi:MAG: hypothetical protein JF593_10835 [Novosphingobium sp.]|nr:hypothetical protein [Novosphingobium sp.]